MTDEIFYLIGSFIIGVLFFSISYKLIMSSIKQMQNENVLKDFETIYYSIESLCKNPNNGLGINYEIPTSIKVVYATDDIENFGFVENFVDSKIYSKGMNFCIFFKDEEKPRCKKLSCQLLMPFLGTLDYQNDFQLLVNKILGKKSIKKYNIYIQNLAGKVVITKDDYINILNFDISYDDYIILVLQLNGEVENFGEKANQIRDTWAEMSPLKKCKDKVKVIAIEDICYIPNQQGICNGDQSTYYQTFYNILECADKNNLGFYNRIVGVLNEDYVCSLPEGSVEGYTAGYGSPVIVAKSKTLETTIHELGHTYGLCDEGYGSGCNNKCESGYSMSGGSSCDSGDICCPNYPEENSIYCTAILCKDCQDNSIDRKCSYDFSFSSSSYLHLEKELEKYCGD
ncbi:MAG: hypothetical protein QXZ43_00760 [Candidatus Aenigmatarchaeota archaeon]